MNVGTSRGRSRWKPAWRSAAVAALVGAVLAVPSAPAGATTGQYGQFCANGKPIFRVPTTQKVVAFTFDDGPSPRNTPKIMSAFEKYGWRATFFLVGENAKAYPALTRSIVQRGHTIGGHSMTHSTGLARNATEIVPTRNLLESLTGVRTTYYRVPGLMNSAKIASTIFRNGMCSLSESYNLFDFLLPRVPAATLCGRMYWALRPGSILLLHDGGSHQPTVDAVPCMLKYAQRRGYRVVPLGDLLSGKF